MWRYSTLICAAWCLLNHVHDNLKGAYGWRLSPAIKAYRSYEKWDPPPEPEPFQASPRLGHLQVSFVDTLRA